MNETKSGSEGCVGRYMQAGDESFKLSHMQNRSSGAAGSDEREKESVVSKTL